MYSAEKKEFIEKSQYSHEGIGYDSCYEVNSSGENQYFEWVQFITKFNLMAENIPIPHTKNHLLFKDNALIPFQEILSVFVLVGMEEFTKRSGHLLDKFSNKALLQMQRSLLKRLAKISSETFYVEFCANNFHFIKRFLGEHCSVESDIPSDTEYRKFVEKMYRGGLKQFLKEYSVLARHISQTVCFWVDFMGDVTAALEKDYVEISRIFFDEDIPGKVISMDIGLSDNHNNNRTVVKLTFENQKCIIYKPRNIGVEVSYYKLLDFLNLKTSVLPQRILKILDCKSYGWVEYVEHLPCNTTEQVKNYYIRAGELLCIVYAFGGTDFHMENIIASGDTPVLIDLEMLINNKREANEINSYTQIDDVISNLNSVNYTGLLPILHVKQDGVISDLSGFGGETDVETTLQEPVWENVNTDSMHLEFKHISKLSCENIVKLKENPVNPANFANEITEGFEIMYKVLIELKGEFLSENGIITNFSHQLLRHTFSNTEKYIRLIQSCLIPKFMRNELEWCEEINRILSIMHTGDCIYISEIISYESQAINKLDVPFINCWSDSKDLNLLPNTTIGNYFKKTSFDNLKENILNLNIEDMKNQSHIIKNSYKLVNEQKKYNPQITSTHIEVSGKRSKQETFLYEAKKTAKIVTENRIESNKSLNWLQFLTSNTDTYIKIMESGLYDGKAGVAVFLAAMSKISCKINYAELVRKILKPINDYFFEVQNSAFPKKMNLGIASGLGGLIYTIALSGELLGDTEICKETINVIPKITNEMIKQDDTFDLIDGCAGMILGLLSIYKETEDEMALLVAIECGKHLLDNRFQSKIGLRAWKHNVMLTEDEQPLCGFAHGASGISFSLLRLFKVTGIKEFLSAAEEAILYEDSFILGGMQQWPDLRKSNANMESEKLYNAWCHGASGILLARIEALDVLDKETMMNDIERALQIIINTPSGGDSVCCGTFGRVNALLTTSQILHRTDLYEMALELAYSSFSKRCAGENNSYAQFYTDFGFFQGMSGIAYSMLRLAHPNKIPSVLSFDI